MSEKVSNNNLVALRSFWGNASSSPRQGHYAKDDHLHLSEIQAEPLELELSRHVLKNVAKATKHDNKNDSSWLRAEYIKPSTEYGLPITVKSNTREFVRIQDIWMHAIQTDPSILDEGALVLNARKNGTPVTGINLAKYRISQAAVQSNVVSTAEDGAALPQSRATPVPTSSLPPTSPPAPAIIEHADLSSGPISSPQSGGVKVSQNSPTAISPTSTLRSSTTSPVTSSDGMTRRPYCVTRTHQAEEYDRSTSMDSSSVSQQRSASNSPARDFGLPMQETPITQGTTPDPHFQLQHGDRQRFSSSTAFSSASTTVTFQAIITTGSNATAIPFGIDHINEAVDDIMAFVDWKNSDGGRGVPVDFKTFMSIMRFRPTASNALILHKE